MNRMHFEKRRLNKRVLTLVGVTVLLIGAIATNLILNQAKKTEDGTLPASTSSGEDESVQASTQTSFFESFRQERNTTREQEIEYLDTIVEQGADEETLADAQRQKMTIVDNMEHEMTIESLLKAKGFLDAAVTLHEGAINVILQAETLTDEQVAQVLDIIIRETGESAENIKVTTAQ